MTTFFISALVGSCIYLLLTRIRPFYLSPRFERQKLAVLVVLIFALWTIGLYSIYAERFDPRTQESTLWLMLTERRAVQAALGVLFGLLACEIGRILRYQDIVKEESEASKTLRSVSRNLMVFSAGIFVFALLNDPNFAFTRLLKGLNTPVLSLEFHDSPSVSRSNAVDNFLLTLPPPRQTRRTTRSLAADVIVNLSDTMRSDSLLQLLSDPLSEFSLITDRPLSSDAISARPGQTSKAAITAYSDEYLSRPLAAADSDSSSTQSNYADFHTAATETTPKSIPLIDAFVVPLVRCLDFVDDEIRYQPHINSYIANLIEAFRNTLRQSYSASEESGKVSISLSARFLTGLRDAHNALVNNAKALRRFDQKNACDALFAIEDEIEERNTSMSVDDDPAAIAHQSDDASQSTQFSYINLLIEEGSKAGLTPNTIIDLTRPYAAIILASLLALNDQPTAAVLELENWIEFASRLQKSRERKFLKPYIVQARLVQILFMQRVRTERAFLEMLQQTLASMRALFPGWIFDRLEMEKIGGRCASDIPLVYRSLYLRHLHTTNTFSFYSTKSSDFLDKYYFEAEQYTRNLMSLNLSCYGALNEQIYRANFLYSRAIVVVQGALSRLKASRIDRHAATQVISEAKDLMYQADSLISDLAEADFIALRNAPLGQRLDSKPSLELQASLDDGITQLDAILDVLQE